MLTQVKLLWRKSADNDQLVIFTHSLFTGQFLLAFASGSSSRFFVFKLWNQLCEIQLKSLHFSPLHSSGQAYRYGRQSKLHSNICPNMIRPYQHYTHVYFRSEWPPGNRKRRVWTELPLTARTNQKSGIRNPESANGSNKPSNKRLHSFWVLARKDICVVSKGITKPWSRDKHDMWSGHFWGVWAKVTPVMGNAA